FLKPLSGKTKAVVIFNAQNITIDAQNAFLKTLEEPPLSTVIILIASHKDLLLPTILSRSTILEEKETTQYSSDELQEIQSFIVQLMNASDAEKLALAEEV